MAKNRKKNRQSRRPGQPGSSSQFPPYLSFDPAITAGDRAAERGLEDLEYDARRAGKRGRQDYRVASEDLERDYGRTTGDISRNFARDLENLGYRYSDAEQDYSRGVEDLGTRRTDLDTDLRRGNEDIGFQLESLGRRYNRQGIAQVQQANAAGVSAGGTNISASRKRADNQAFERRPIDQSATRMNEDYGRNVGLLEQTGTRLSQDYGTEVGRLNTSGGRTWEDALRNQGELDEDVVHDRGLLKRDFKRDNQDRRTEVGRGRREQAIGHQDNVQSAIWGARLQNPGAFSRTGRKTKRRK